MTGPLRLYETVVPDDWLDYNGHVSEFRYLQAFGDNSDAFFRHVGIDESYRDSGRSLYTVETHQHNIREIGAGAELAFTLRVLDVDTKRLHIFHEMYCDEDLLATAEQMLLHVDMGAGRVTAMPPWLHERLSALHAEHAVLPKPVRTGSVIGIRRQREARCGST
ncbi:thioesterase family protein [Actinocrispum sp. NPDC049592]|uniref:thioesterase family protein n=1 Tax=Actinocrispum sp. NPDC049592 TaxID=3154835 RepID=UPI003427D288